MTAVRTRSVRRRFFVRAPPGQVYRAISQPEGLVRWMVESADLPLRRGAPYRLVFQGGWVHEGQVLSFRPGRGLTLAWAWPGVPLKGTSLVLSVRAAPGGALLLIEHKGFPRTEKWVDLYGVTEWGWTYYGMNLKSVLESGRDLRSDRDG